jgi:hypothetical protein
MKKTLSRLGILLLACGAFAFIHVPAIAQNNPSGPSASGSGTQQPSASGSGTQTQNPTTFDFHIDNPVTGFDNIPDLIVSLLDLVMLIVAPIIALMIIYAGFLFVTASGNEGKLGKAKEMLLYVIIGAAIILGAEIIATAIQGTVNALI